MLQLVDSRERRIEILELHKKVQPVTLSFKKTAILLINRPEASGSTPRLSDAAFFVIS